MIHYIFIYIKILQIKEKMTFHFCYFIAIAENFNVFYFTLRHEKKNGATDYKYNYNLKQNLNSSIFGIIIHLLS